MKIFTASQIHDLDRYTIEHEPISSVALMERAAVALKKELLGFCNEETEFIVFAGPGNNGGDALAVTRLLRDEGVKAVAYLFNVSGKLSDDCAANRDRLKAKYADALKEITQEFEPPKLTSDVVVVDGLFGSGLSKPLTGGFAAVVRYINQSDAKVVSIDLPSGLMPEDNMYNVRQNIIEADVTLTLGMKKLCMMLADNQQYVGELRVLDIGLSRDFIRDTDAQYEVVDEMMVRCRMLSRDKFAHKGTMGHALLVAGSYGMAGAALLASKACLRSGVGKLTVHTPLCNSTIMQLGVPEAVVDVDRDEESFSQAVDSSRYDALGIGPGLGTLETAAVAMMTQIRSSKVPVVIDADALNILAVHRAWLQQLPDGMILTPHPKEMDKLCDTAPADDYDRLMKASDLAQRLRGYIILKGHYSALCMPDGKIYFNSTGNAGMATAGSGDVLTGIITGLLARGYVPADAALVGMYLHGLAGDYAARDLGMESLIAGDIIKYLPKAFSYSLYNR
ncbi:MAG: NAD(P)H-hydrate dehydratase [Prevotella sp.]|nr:NAD(P)H-hydrate dehydratase [Prevotella sp.]MBR6192174.1 NAD(P)H-hydrate dehydratase [Prevotella sp.]